MNHWGIFLQRLVDMIFKIIFSKESGQTLVEALLAVAFAVVVVVALVGVGITAMRTADYGKNQAEATRLSTQALEYLRSQRDAGWSGFRDSAFNTCKKGPPPKACCLSLSGGSVQLKPIDDPGHNNTDLTYDELYGLSQTDSSYNVCFPSPNYATYVFPDTTQSGPNFSGYITYVVHTMYMEGSLQQDVTLTQTFTNWH